LEEINRCTDDSHASHLEGGQDKAAGSVQQGERLYPSIILESYRNHHNCIRERDRDRERERELGGWVFLGSSKIWAHPLVPRITQACQHLLLSNQGT
jgi:hypothetical protein